jgi:hypothetical protein
MEMNKKTINGFDIIMIPAKELAKYLEQGYFIDRR